MANRKTFIFILLSAAIVFISGAAYIADKALFWRAQLNELSALSNTQQKFPSKDQHRVVFIGDSIIDAFPVKALISNDYLVVNQGVKGNIIEEIQQRYESILRETSHDIVVVEGGINNILGGVLDGRNENEVYDSIIKTYGRILDQAIVNQVKPLCFELLPVTHAFLLPYSRMITLPTDYDVAQVNKLVLRVNDGLKQLCSSRSISIIETFEPFSTPQGEADRRYFHIDGYHVNVFGYSKMASLINSHLDKISIDQ